MRRWISTLLAALMLANLVAWPSVALAEALQHEHEAADFASPLIPPSEPAPANCQHGCAGHYGHHFHGQVPSMSAAWSSSERDSIEASIQSPLPQDISAPLFRPPLFAPIRS